MRGKNDPDWKDLVQSWKDTQDALRRRIRVQPYPDLPRFVAGADVAFTPDTRHAIAVALVWDRVERRVVEMVHARKPLDVPYVPGFLSFREGPVLFDALGKLTHGWEVLCIDGQGYAHPRRCGLAAHVCVQLDRPGIGVAKSRLIGTYDEPPQQAGASSPLMDQEEQIGLVLRTRAACRPLFISIAHKMDLPSAARIVMACITGPRVPEPTRQADIAVRQLKFRGTTD